MATEKKRRSRRKSEKSGVTLVRNFLLPHLEQKTFGEKLFWAEKEKGKFKVLWRHQGCSRFSPLDCEVFCEWAKLKHLWKINEPKANTIAKQRFRAALQKIKNVKYIGNEDEYRVYKLIPEDKVPEVKTEKPEFSNGDINYVKSDNCLNLWNLQQDVNMYISHLKNWLQS